MPVDRAWVDGASVATALFSTLTAIVALVVAIRSDRRSREALRVQIYMELRAGFLDIFRELGALDEDSNADEIEVKMARTAYWHHAWDEWYVAKGLAPQEFSGLWDDFFAKAVMSGYRHPALRKVLDELGRRRDTGFGAYAQDLIVELRRLDKVMPRIDGDESIDRVRE